ncbi:MAG: hypothetical protein ABIT47_00625 [Candidatus Paceibacterota bacterium]
MTTSTKTVLGIAAAIVLAIGVVLAYRTHDANDTAASTETGLPTLATDTSDSAIQQDADAIDAQLQATDSDNSTVQDGIQTHGQVQ